MPASELLTSETISFSRLNAQTIGSGTVFASSMQLLIQRIDALAETTEFRFAGFRATINEDTRFGVRRFHIGEPGRMSFRRFFELMVSIGLSALSFTASARVTTILVPFRNASRKGIEYRFTR